MVRITLIAAALFTTVASAAQTLSTSQYIRMDGNDKLLQDSARLEIYKNYLQLVTESETVRASFQSKITTFDEIRIDGCNVKVLGYFEGSRLDIVYLTVGDRKWYLEYKSNYKTNQ